MAPFPRVSGGCRPLSPCACCTELLSPHREWCTPCQPPGWGPSFPGSGRVPLAAGSGWRPFIPRAFSFPHPFPPGHGRVTPGDPLFFRMAALPSTSLLQSHSARLLLSLSPSPRPCSILHSIFFSLFPLFSIIWCNTDPVVSFLPPAGSYIITEIEI